VGPTSPIIDVNVFIIWIGNIWDILLGSYSVMSSIPDNVENNGFHSKLVQYGMDVVLLKKSFHSNRSD
jgi:hypothetical protein